MESISRMEYPARNNGVATASNPSGAVASVLANEGKKNTTFFDMRLSPIPEVPEFLKIRAESQTFVTGLSPDCQLFPALRSKRCFRVTVDLPETLP